MLYVKSKKSFKVRRQKKFIALPCAKKKHTANHDFAVCHKKAHDKVFLCRVLKKHTANHDFAVCFGFAVCFLEHTRQKSCLPCVREFAYGKLWCTRQNRSFRQCQGQRGMSIDDTSRVTIIYQQVADIPCKRVKETLEIFLWQALNHIGDHT